MSSYLDIIIETAKETAIEMIKSGIPVSDVTNQLSKKFGNANTRFIMSDIALDLGMENETKQYLSKF